jgi:hypothetical protein
MLLVIFDGEGYRNSKNITSRSDWHKIEVIVISHMFSSHVGPERCD